MSELRDRLAGALKDEGMKAHADRVRIVKDEDDDDDKDGIGQKRCEEIDFIPLRDNTDFFDGEGRFFCMMYFSGGQFSLDYSRLDLFFAVPEGHYRIILHGENLRALRKLIRWRKVSNVRQTKVNELQAEAGIKPKFTVTGMAYEMVEKQRGEE